MATTSKRRRRVLLGVVVLVATVAGAVALWLSADARRSDAIGKFARAPVGCDTTLDFADTGRYYVYVETVGRLPGDVRGDCGAATTYDVGATAPTVEVTMVDPDGAQLDVVDTDGPSYADDGYRGQAVFEVDVAEAADHVIRVESPSSESFAVAVGRDPDAGVGLLQGAAVVVALAGLVVGLALIVARGRSAEVAPAGAWTPAQPGAPWESAAPTQPPYRQPPVGPPGATPPSSPPTAPGGPPSWPGQVPPPAPGPAGTPPTAPSATGSWADNPFAPPTGPAAPVAPPTQRPAPSSPGDSGTAATGDGATPWPNSLEDDDVPTPPSGSARPDDGDGERSWGSDAQ